MTSTLVNISIIRAIRRFNLNNLSFSDREQSVCAGCRLHRTLIPFTAAVTGERLTHLRAARQNVNSGGLELIKCIQLHVVLIPYISATRYKQEINTFSSPLGVLQVVT